MSVMNTSILLFALVAVSAVSCWNQQYGWPDDFEYYLQNQGIYNYETHSISESYMTRSTYVSDLTNLYNDWQQQTGWGTAGYNAGNFVTPTGGYEQYGFPGYGK